MTTLYDVVNTFWHSWFGVSLDSDLLNYIVLASVIMLVYGIILRPIFRLLSR